jgi:hypothetical protein
MNFNDYLKMTEKYSEHIRLKKEEIYNRKLITATVINDEGITNPFILNNNGIVFDEKTGEQLFSGLPILKTQSIPITELKPHYELYRPYDFNNLYMVSLLDNNLIYRTINGFYDDNVKKIEQQKAKSPEIFQIMENVVLDICSTLNISFVISLQNFYNKHKIGFFNKTNILYHFTKRNDKEVYMVYNEDNYVDKKNIQETERELMVVDPTVSHKPLFKITLS